MAMPRPQQVRPCGDSRGNWASICAAFGRPVLVGE